MNDGTGEVLWTILSLTVIQSLGTLVGSKSHTEFEDPDLKRVDILLLLRRTGQITGS